MKKRLKPCSNPDELFKAVVEYLEKEKPIKYTIKSHPDMIQEYAACELNSNYVGDEYNYDDPYGAFTYIRKLYDFKELPKDADTLLSCLDKEEFLSARDIVLRLGCKEYYKEHNNSALSNCITRTLKQHIDKIDIKEGKGKLPCQFKLKN